MNKFILFLAILLIPAMAASLVLMPVDDPYQNIGIPDNTVIDIIQHDGAVWFATSRGVAYSLFDDNVWNSYDETNGLVAGNISALYSNGETLWVAQNHIDEAVEAIISDGLTITDDMGQTWDMSMYDTTAEGDYDTILTTGTVGGQKVIYDIAGLDSIIFTASWAGGLTQSFDGGNTWKRVYYSRADSIADTSGGQPTLTNRYFSAVVDTTHNDSLILWSGTAGGLMEYVWAPDYAKLGSNYIMDVNKIGDWVYICGDSGLSRVKFVTEDDVTNQIYDSRFMRDGLPGMAVTTAFGFGGKVFVGTLDSVIGDGSGEFYKYGEGIGLAISDDNGETFNTLYTGLNDLIGENRYPKEFASIAGRLFMAAGDAGLFFSDDSGSSWTRLPNDTLDASFDNPFNVANSVFADSNNLWVGTDSGLAVIYCDDTGSDTLHKYIYFEDGFYSGARSYKVSVQHIFDSVPTDDADTAWNISEDIRVWTLNHAIDTAVGMNAVMTSEDYGDTWTEEVPYQGTERIPYYDITFINDAIILGGKEILAYTIDRLIWGKYSTYQIYDILNTSITFSGLDMISCLAVGDTLYLGSEHGIGYSIYPSFQYRINRANHNPVAYDDVRRFTYSDLTGNFVNVLGLQPLPNGESRIWASTRPATSTSEYLGVSSGKVDGSDWRTITSMEAWNFAFNGAEVFAATTDGLLYSRDTGNVFDYVPLKGIQVSSDPPVDAEIDPNARVTAVKVIGDSLWVGTEGGGAGRIALSDLQSGNYEAWSIYRTYDSSFTTYAYPVPFSHALSTSVYFHYYVPTETSVTLEVYDFAMDLVRRVIDNETRSEGIYNTDKWDGRNGRGDQVAVGMYYYKLTYSSGDVYWGKLAIVP